MKLETFSDITVYDRLAPVWNALLSISASNVIFLTNEWQKTWWEVFHPGELKVIVGRNASDEIVGIAPWFVGEHGGERVVRTVGCVDVTDYLDIIAVPGHRSVFLDALAQHLSESADDFDRISLCNIPETSPTLKEFPALLEQHGFKASVVQQEVCPVIPLPGSWDDYLAGLNKKQRHELRRKIRRAGENLDWYIVGPEHDLLTETEEFLRLMAASSPEKAAFLTPENRHFFELLTDRMYECGWLQLAFLTVDGERAATYLNFDYANHILVYNSGQDVEQFGALSPGIVLLANLIKHAIETRHTAFDFLRGNERYKYQMGGQDTAVYRLAAQQGDR